MKIRTRIAPSPTGHLHIGGLRTSLYNYALAKKYNGQFILRIEDTDRTRFVEGAIEKIQMLHKYLDLHPDEGPEQGGPHKPYIQSKRLDKYLKYAKELIEKEKAYYCFCSQERLDSLKKKQRESGIVSTKYDKQCLNLSKDEIRENLESGSEYVIRLNVPSNINITWNDEVYGEITVNTSDLDDQVLIKSDGYPTYHMAVVVDDHEMDITHILRGNDWIPSTPKHVLLYQYLGWERPLYAHLPNLKEVDGSKKLSKRFGSVAVEDFLSEGYLKEALLNHLMFLGWNPGTEKEVFSLSEFVDEFDIDKLQKTDLVSFDRDKLLWYNGVYVRNMSDEDLMNRIKAWAKDWDVDLRVSRDDEFNYKVISMIKDRLKKLSEFPDLTSYFFVRPDVQKEMLTQFSGDEKRAVEIINVLLELYSDVNDKDWHTQNLDKRSHDLLGLHDLKPKETFMTLRVGVTGQTATPPVFDIIDLLGKKETISRLKDALKKCY
jgi:glutamyl-tRNA synthetase